MNSSGGCQTAGVLKACSLFQTSISEYYYKRSWKINIWLLGVIHCFKHLYTQYSYVLILVLKIRVSLYLAYVSRIFFSLENVSSI